MVWLFLKDKTLQLLIMRWFRWDGISNAVGMWSISICNCNCMPNHLSVHFHAKTRGKSRSVYWTFPIFKIGLPGNSIELWWWCWMGWDSNSFKCLVFYYKLAIDQTFYSPRITNSGSQYYIQKFSSRWLGATDPIVRGGSAMFGLLDSITLYSAFLRIYFFCTT